MQVLGVNKMEVSFGWSGPTHQQTAEGLHSIQRINLVFEGAKTQVCVTIPLEFPQVGEQRLSLTCRKFQNETFQQETVASALKLSADQIRNLHLESLFVKNGTETKVPIPFEKPETLDEKQQYCLMVTSNALQLKAAFVKEKTITDEQYKNDCTCTEMILLTTVSGVFPTAAEKFYSSLNPDQKRALTITDVRKLSVVSVARRVKKINRFTLRSLIEKIDQAHILKTARFVVPEQIQFSFKLTVATIGDQVLRDLAREFFTLSFAKDVPNYIPAGVEPLIEEAASDFVNRCKSIQL